MEHIQKQIEKTVKWAEKQAEAVKEQPPEQSEGHQVAEAEPASMTHEISNHPPATFTNKVGAPPKYQGEKTCDAAKMMAAKGWIDAEIAKGLIIAESTLYEWKKDYPELSEAIKAGKDLIDTMVEKSLLNRAMGCSIKETKVHLDKHGDVHETEIDRHLPPDVTAQIFWLKNRKPKVWRDKHEVDFTNPLTINMGEADQKTL